MRAGTPQASVTGIPASSVTLQSVIHCVRAEWLLLVCCHFAGRQIVLEDDSFSTETSVALIIANTGSPFLRFIRFTELVVMIEVTDPAAVLMTISETTLSEVICSIVPGKRFRILVLMTC